MDCKFTAGQRVVCVRDDFNWTWRGLGLALPRRHHVYVVRDIVIRTFNDSWAPTPALLFMEIINRTMACCQGATHAEIAFWHRRFEPYVPRETDIGELESLTRRRSKMVTA